MSFFPFKFFVLTNASSPRLKGVWETQREIFIFISTSKTTFTMISNQHGATLTHDHIALWLGKKWEKESEGGFY